jgi:signal transduction histidine kinase
VAIVTHDPAALEGADLAREIGAAARLAVDNERLQAEARARLVDLRASRARIVETADAERIRLERNLHDGAQQRLVGLSLALRLARSEVDPERAPGLAQEIDRADAELQTAIAELRELAQGIYPVVLTTEGLAAAVEALAERATVPIEVQRLTEERLPSQVEAAAYYLISEALGHATRAGTSLSLDVERSPHALVVELHADGADGAADFIDVADRVGALDGILQVARPPQGGMRIRAEIPCE